jgi:hypothetical protein
LQSVRASSDREPKPLDWARYKTLCDRPDVLSRWIVERTLVLLEAEAAAVPPRDAGVALAESLRGVLATEPLPRPVGHTGPAATYMFIARLDPHVVHGLLAAVERSATAGRLAEALGQRSPTGYLAAWREYAAFVARASEGPTVIC